MTQESSKEIKKAVNEITEILTSLVSSVEEQMLKSKGQFFSRKYQEYYNDGREFGAQTMLTKCIEVVRTSVACDPSLKWIQEAIEKALTNLTPNQ